MIAILILWTWQGGVGVADRGQRGDGQITVAEFLEGAIRLRGLAKSVDLAQAGK